MYVTWCSTREGALEFEGPDRYWLCSTRSIDQRKTFEVALPFAVGTRLQWEARVKCGEGTMHH